MGKRREAREFAVQLIYALDALKAEGDDLEQRLVRFWSLRDKEVSGSVRSFAESLVRGTMQHLETINQALRNTSQNWDLERMAAVDRAILRVALFEILFCPDTPTAVVINEAIEIAKRFSNEDSGRFINGVLDRIGKDPGRALQSESPKKNSPSEQGTRSSSSRGLKKSCATVAAQSNRQAADGQKTDRVKSKPPIS